MGSTSTVHHLHSTIISENSMMPGKSDQWKYLGGGALTLGVATAVTSRYLRGSHTQPEGAISADNQTVQVPVSNP